VQEIAETDKNKNSASTSTTRLWWNAHVLCSRCMVEEVRALTKAV